MKENKQVNPAVSSCTAEIVQKDGLAKISRSPGIAVHNYIVGGGWRGCSNELDTVVMREAEFSHTFVPSESCREYSHPRGTSIVFERRGMADRLQEGRHRQQQQYRPGCQPCEQQTACNFIGREDEDVQRGIPATVPRNGFHDVLHTHRPQESRALCTRR